MILFVRIQVVSKYCCAQFLPLVATTVLTTVTTVLYIYYLEFYGDKFFLYEPGAREMMWTVNQVVMPQ